MGGSFYIGNDGKIITDAPQSDPVDPDFSSENPQIYWTFRFINNLPSENHDSFKELSVRLKGIFVRLGKDFDVEPIRKSPLKVLPTAILPPGINVAMMPSNSGSIEQPKESKSFFDDFRNIETSIGDFYFS